VCSRGIAYDYAEAPSPARADAGAASGSLLPAALADEIQNAARAADYEHLCDLIRSVPEDQAAVAEALGELLERYAYDEIDALLRR
jgi:hypothetical protein